MQKREKGIDESRVKKESNAPPLLNAANFIGTGAPRKVASCNGID
jgi:hypothetical protein